MCKHQNHFYSFNRKRSSIRKKMIFSPCFWLIIAREVVHFPVILHFWTCSLFLYLCFPLSYFYASDVVTIYFIFVLWFFALWYARDTRCIPVAVRVQWTVKMRSERSDTGTFEEGRKKEREKERELVRRKDNRTIKSQIRGQLVLGRVSRGCRRNSQETREKVC